MSFHATYSACVGHIGRGSRQSTVCALVYHNLDTIVPLNGSSTAQARSRLCISCAVLINDFYCLGLLYVFRMEEDPAQSEPAMVLREVRKYIFG